LWNSDGSLITSLEGHTNRVSSISFSSDGKTIATASDDQTVKLWKYDGTLLKTLNHSDKVNSVGFSPDGKTVASGSDDRTIKLWTNDGTLLKTLNNTDKVNSISFSPDGKTIATASDDRTVKLWKYNGVLLKTLNHSDKVNSVSFSPDGKTIASAGNDGTVKAWTSDGIEIKSIKGSRELVSLDFSPVSQTLAVVNTNDYPSTLFLAFIDGFWFKDTKLNLNQYLSAISFSPDGQSIAAATERDGVLILNLDQNELIKRGCKLVSGFLKNGPNVEDSDRTLCDHVETKK
jgi:WD40 repeat protein